MNHCRQPQFGFQHFRWVGRCCNWCKLGWGSFLCQILTHSHIDCCTPTSKTPVLLFSMRNGGINVNILYRIQHHLSLPASLETGMHDNYWGQSLRFESGETEVKQTVWTEVVVHKTKTMGRKMLKYSIAPRCWTEINTSCYTQLVSGF